MNSQQADELPPLTVGEIGYIFDHGDYWPARVLANDVLQTFGNIDAIVAYQKTGKVAGHEFTVRLTNRWDSCSGLRWVSANIYANRQLQEIKEERMRLDERERALASQGKDRNGGEG
jgi:hypothetical protein